VLRATETAGSGAGAGWSGNISPLI
jgi:hypothetical protein